MKKLNIPKICAEIRHFFTRREKKLHWAEEITPALLVVFVTNVRFAVRDIFSLAL